jgi:ribosomal protein S18 acetylase RimI-like enzyme
MHYTITYEADPNPNDIQFLNDGITAEHKRKKEMKPLDFFAYFIRDDQGLIVGGCAGDNMYGGLFVGQLWVTENLRGKGYGTKLMSLAEELARKSQCQFISVNTFDWEALDFYKKLGFYVEFARHGYDKKSVFNFLRKDLGTSNE